MGERAREGAAEAEARGVRVQVGALREHLGVTAGRQLNSVEGMMDLGVQLWLWDLKVTVGKRM